MDFDRIKQSISDAVRSLLGERIDYLALYPATVKQQNGQTLELMPDDARVPPVSQVPLNLGVPGVTVTVQPGSRVLLGFAGGDPQKPRAFLWESGSVAQMNLNATTIILNDGVLPVARATQDTAGPYPIRGGNLTVKA